MSIPISKIEATAIARFLSATTSHIDGTKLSHASCLHVLARAYGYRNWNAMQPDVSDIPDVAKFDDGYGFGRSGARRFAIASVDVQGRERSFMQSAMTRARPACRRWRPSWRGLSHRPRTFEGRASTTQGLIPYRHRRWVMNAAQQLRPWSPLPIPAK